jgi:hypothetical protein
MARGSDIFVLGLALALGAPAAAAPRPVDSWGRAGVDYATYRNDSIECALLGHTADVSQTAQAQALVTATRRMEAVDNSNYVSPSASSSQATDLMMTQAIRYQQIRRGVRPEKQIAELKQGLLHVVEDCLRERGYVRFRLTEEQRVALTKLRHGSEERHAFLHALAADPAVLEAQALPDAS